MRCRIITGVHGPKASFSTALTNVCNAQDFEHWERSDVRCEILRRLRDQDLVQEMYLEPKGGQTEVVSSLNKTILYLYTSQDEDFRISCLSVYQLSICPSIYLLSSL